MERTIHDTRKNGTRETERTIHVTRSTKHEKDKKIINCYLGAWGTEDDARDTIHGKRKERFTLHVARNTKKKKIY